MIHPNNFHTIKPAWNKFSVAKLPVYLLSLSNCILYKTDKKWIFEAQLILALTVHLGGLALHAVYIFGVASNEALPLIPVILVYVFLASPSYMIINAYLFMLKSFSLKTSSVLNLLDQRSAPHVWSFKYKGFMVLMMVLAALQFGSLFSVTTAFFKTDIQYHMVFYFMEDKYQAQIIGRVYQAYTYYLLIYYVTFPAYTSYLCISLNKMINNLQQNMQDIVQKGGNSSIISEFDCFIKDFDQMVDTVSITNECHSVSIAWFVFLSVSQMVTWLYLEIAVNECSLSENMAFHIVLDIMSVLIVLGLVSSVYSKVQNYFQYICIVKIIEFYI